MGRGRAQASAAEGIADAVVFSILLLVALWILSVIFPGFVATFGFFNRLSSSRHWCENSLGGGSIFMVSGWPDKGHGSLG